MSANSRQVAGGHYASASGIQHWDIVVQHNLNYFEGQITKYVMRARKKNGKQDLEKAKHFIEKYLEVYDQIQPIKEPVPTPTGLAMPIDFKGHYTIEGYRTDGTALYTCLHCNFRAWLPEMAALNHLQNAHPDNL